MHKTFLIIVQAVAVAVVLFSAYLYRPGTDVGSQPAWRDAALDELIRYGGSVIPFSVYIPKKSILPVEVFEYRADGATAYDQVSIVLPVGTIDGGDEQVPLNRQNARRADFGWQIYFSDVKDDDELLAFIRKRYGSLCVITQTRMEAGGVLDLQINNEGVDSPVCSAAGPYFIKYDPEAGRVATWMVGNGGSFAAQVGNENVDFWNPMGESFSF